MLTIIDVGSDHVVGFVLDGRISDDEMDRAMCAVEQRLQRFPRLNVYVEIKTLGGVSLEAFVRNIKFKIKHFRDFEKSAVVTDLSWLSGSARAIDKIFPTIEARAFSVEDKDQAVRWICQ